MRTTIAEINIENLKHNVNALKGKAQGSKLMAVVKANAYGHGAIGVSKILRQEGVEYLAVAFPSEAFELRMHGDRGKICVIVPSAGEDIDIVVGQDLEPSVSSIEIARLISDEADKAGKVINIHLFVDTGMHRDGLMPDAALPFMQEASKLDGIKVIGIMTHFAAADDDDPAFTIRQINTFNKTIEMLKLNGFQFEMIHAANTPGLLNVKECLFNVVRPGLALHGLFPSRKLLGKLDLKPTLTLKSQVRLVKFVKKGETVGYSFKYVADKDLNIAVLSIGYGDGFFVANTNKSQCIINGKKYDLIGSICMDQCMADIGFDDIKPGDEAIFIGKQNGEEISVYDLAERLGTITYEITTALNNRVPRRYV